MTVTVFDQSLDQKEVREMRGRRKKDIPPAKDRFVGLRFTEEQYSVLEHNARQARLSVSEYIRRAVLKQKIPAFQPIIHDEHEILEELKNINKIGNNLNQIARYFNQGGMINNQIAIDLKNVIKLLNDSCMRFDAAVVKEYGNGKAY